MEKKRKKKKRRSQDGLNLNRSEIFSKHDSIGK